MVAPNVVLDLREIFRFALNLSIRNLPVMLTARVLSIATLLVFLVLGTLPLSAAAGNASTEQPPGLDDQGWSSLQKAVREQIAQPSKLTGDRSVASAEGAKDDWFGDSVAVYGDTAVVGTPYDAVGGSLEQGSAHVFVRRAGVWAQQAKLVAADGAAFDLFGGTVALHGDTALVSAFLADIGPNSDQGATYVFIRTGETWTQQAKLVAADGAADKRLGRSVALSGDTALVSDDRESAYVFTRNNGLWTQQAKLTANDAVDFDGFGYSVALSGDTALVGARGADVLTNPDQGAAYVFSRTGISWSQRAKLVANDGAARHRFGESVALDGDTALIGAWGQDLGNGRYRGAAYVFVQGNGVWTQQAKLVAADGSTSDQFGFSVALSGESALVGAYLTEIGTNSDQGAAHVFTRSGAQWSQQALLVAEDGSNGDRFGSAVSLHGDTAVMGAFSADIGTNSNQGAAYVLERTAGSWSQQHKLHTGIGSTEDQFGFSVAVAGDTALVGAPFDDVGSNIDQGSAFVFRRSGNAWLLRAKLVAEDGASGDRFGHAVAVSGDTALVGAYLHSVGSAAEQGSTYVFTRNGSTWTQQAKLVPNDGRVFDWFGYAVAVSGDTALVGARFGDVGASFNQGSAYVFTRNGGIWTQQAKLVAADGAEQDWFGSSVALFGNTALVGATQHGVSGVPRQGAAYVFTRAGSFWSQQAKLVAADGGFQDFFGLSVALSADTALVGARLDLLNAGQERGAVYVYTRDGSLWTQQARLAPSDSAVGDRFGNSVALSGDLALVGSARRDVGTNSDQGAAYVFGRSGSTWTQLSKLVAEDGEAGDGFGSGVALSGRTAIIGANGANGPAPYGNPDEGAAFIGSLGTVFEDGFEAAAEPVAPAVRSLH
ncbi:MAG: FG-GAP repeat protein [Lysobacterales bacterium]